MAQEDISDLISQQSNNNEVILTNVECALNHTHPSSLSLLFFHLFSIFLDAYYVGGRAHQVLGF